MELNTKIYTVLEQLGIEVNGGSLRALRCPKCADTRSKKGARTLQVYVEPPYLGWRCYHVGCEWETYQSKRIGGEVVTERKDKEISYINIPEGVKLPVDKTTTVYPYRDTEGNILYYGARTKEKSFMYFSLTSDNQLITRARPVKVLYGAETIGDSDTVAIVEGEKARDAAVSKLKYPVVTWPGGAQSVERGDWDLLKGKNIIIFPDNDEAGKAAAEKIVKLVKARRLAIADVSHFPPKGDLADDVDVQKAIDGRKDIVKHHLGLDDAITLEDLIEDLKSESKLEGLGWGIMDSVVRLPKTGLVVVEGRSGHGKSSFMLNMLWNKLQEGKKCLFFSYEMPASRVALKLAMIAEGVVKGKGAHENHEKYLEEIIGGKSKGWELLNEYITSEQLTIIDKGYDNVTLNNYLDNPELKDALVFIDYIQIVPFQGRGDARYLEIKNTAEKWRSLSNDNKFIIVTGAQLTNGDQPLADVVREGKDIYNSAELVLRVWNISAGNTTGAIRKDLGEEDLERAARGDFNWIIDVRKNRNGELGGKFKFLFEAGFKLTEVGNGKSMAKLDSVLNTEESEKKLDF